MAEITGTIWELFPSDLHSEFGSEQGGPTFVQRIIWSEYTPGDRVIVRDERGRTVFEHTGQSDLDPIVEDFDQPIYNLKLVSLPSGFLRVHIS